MDASKGVGSAGSAYSVNGVSIERGVYLGECRRLGEIVRGAKLPDDNDVESIGDILEERRQGDSAASTIIAGVMPYEEPALSESGSS